MRYRAHCCQSGDAVDTKPADSLDDDDRAEHPDHEADQRYADAIPPDATLHSAFHRRLAEESSAFASTRE
jgi:hypothetical protein